MSKRLIYLYWFLSVSVFLLIASKSHADTYLMLGQWSKHHTPKDYYNEKHDLIGLEHNQFFVANFINSEFDSTWIAGYSQKLKYGFSLNWALVSGYEHNQLFPIAVPSYTFGKGLVQLDLNIIPFVVYTAGFRIKLDYFAKGSKK